MNPLRTVVRRVGALTGLALLLVTIGTAQAGPATKEYGVTIEPAGTPGTYTLTVTNAARSTHTLGSVDVGAPAGLAIGSVGAAAAPAGKSWTAAPAGSTVELRAASQGDALAPGEQVSATLMLAGCSSAAWATRAKQSNAFNGPPGNDFKLTGAAPVASGGGGAAVELEFVVQPTLTQVDTAIAPAVAVEALDGCGNPAVGEVTVAIAGGANPSGGTLAGTVSLPLDADGVATFSDLSIDASGAGYALTASSAGASATSEAFSVVDYLCRAALVCEASDAGGTTKVGTPGPPAGGAMGLSFGEFESGFSCDGAGGFESVGSIATIDPYGYLAPITVMARWSKSEAPGTGVATCILCWSKSGADYAVARRCTKAGALPHGAKLCELKRNRNGVGDLVIEFVIAPNDPYAGLGN